MRRNHKVLLNGDASIIGAITSPVCTRYHALEALTVLSKYCGIYNRLKEIIAKYQLQWGSAAEDNLSTSPTIYKEMATLRLC